jgi:hypothetical protein
LSIISKPPFEVIGLHQPKLPKKFDKNDFRQASDAQSSEQMGFRGPIQRYRLGTKS